MNPQILTTRTLHQGWCKLVSVRLRLADGKVIDREVEDHGRAVAVLPYDPVRRVALLVRLLRVPVLLSAGAADLLEVPAGLIEEDEPADTARRELQEEAGLRVETLDHIGRVWTSPGISTERTDLYLAVYRERDRVGPGGGLASEHENITVVELPFDEVWSKLQANDIMDMKTMTLILALHARRPELFGASGRTASSAPE